LRAVLHRYEAEAVDVAVVAVIQDDRYAGAYVPIVVLHHAVDGSAHPEPVAVIRVRAGHATDHSAGQPVGGVPAEAVGAAAREVAVVVVAVARALDGAEAVGGVVGVVVAILGQPVADGVVGVGVGLGPGVGDARQAVEVVVAVGVRAEAVDALGAVAGAVVGD